jgi:hypothetical protein
MFTNVSSGRSVLRHLTPTFSSAPGKRRLSGSTFHFAFTPWLRLVQDTTRFRRCPGRDPIKPGVAANVGCYVILKSFDVEVGQCVFSSQRTSMRSESGFPRR